MLTSMAGHEDHRQEVETFVAELATSSLELAEALLGNARFLVELTGAQANHDDHDGHVSLHVPREVWELALSHALGAGVTVEEVVAQAVRSYAAAPGPRPSPSTAPADAGPTDAAYRANRPVA